MKKFTRKLSKKQRKELRDKQLIAGCGLVVRTVGPDGRKKVRAAPPLKWSEHYPTEFCNSIVKYKDELEIVLLLHVNCVCTVPPLISLEPACYRVAPRQTWKSR